MLFFLNKMFHIKGTRWRFVPYVIRKGRSLDRIQGIKRDRSDAALFAYGGESLSLAICLINPFHKLSMMFLIPIVKPQKSRFIGKIAKYILWHRTVNDYNLRMQHLQHFYNAQMHQSFFILSLTTSISPD